jgi:hypothetical protein
MLTYQVAQPFGLRFQGKNYKQFELLETAEDVTALIDADLLDLYDAGTSPEPPVPPTPADYAGYYDAMQALPEFLIVRDAASASLPANMAYTDIGVALNALMKGITPVREAGFCQAQANLIAALPTEDQSAVATALQNLATDYNCKVCPLP